jgi:hypothetical protein
VLRGQAAQRFIMSRFTSLSAISVRFPSDLSVSVDMLPSPLQIAGLAVN